MPKITFKHGLKATMPKLDFREPAITDDTEEIFVGGNTENIQLAKQADLETTNTNVGQKADKTYVDGKIGDISSTGYEDIATGLNDHTIQLADIAIQMYPSGIDDTTAITNAITSTKNNILWHDGTYYISSPIVASLVGKRKWIMQGNVVFKYTGTTNDIMLTIDQAGYDFEIEGSLTIDGDHKARQGLKIQNLSVSMSNAVNLLMKDVKAKNIYSTTVGSGAVGITVQGGYNLIILVRAGADTISRAIGVGNPGYQGTNGILISHSGVNAYPRQVVIDDPYLNVITSDEVDGSGDNLDCDGLAVFAPTDGNGYVMSDSFLSIKKGTYKNCRGRSIKSQMAYSTVDSPTFIRDSIKSIQNGVEVDFQYGVGSLRGKFKCIYNPLPDGSTPFGASFTILNSSLRARNDGVGYLEMEEGEIINNVAASNLLPYLITFSADAGFTYSKFTMKNIKHLGIGRFNIGIYGDLTKVQNVRVDDGYFSWIAASLVKTTVSAPNTNVILNNNHHAQTAVKLFDGVGKISAINNVGFIKDLTNNSGTSTYADGVRTDRLIAKDATYGGTFAIEELVFNNTDTKTFGQRGLETAKGIYFISCSYTQDTHAIFAVSGNTIVVLAQSGASAIAFGLSGSNPNTAGKLNVWCANNVINVNNQLGSPRYVTLASIG